ncbi:MAG: AAA family ATPase [Bryobacteraceae bacterium]|jgi:hypothetical protein
MIRTTTSFGKAFHTARRVSTPLIAVRTPDPASAIQLILSTFKADETPALHWDAVRGIVGLNEAGRRHVPEILGELEPTAVNPETLFVIAEKLGPDSLLFVANAHRFYGDVGVTQGIWNLRDAYKSRGCTLILLTTLSGCLPEELAQDVLTLDEPLPSCEELSRIVRETVEAAEMNALSATDLQRAVDALIGLAAFPAEQVVAMSLSKEGLDAEQLWERKRQIIEQSPGLKIWRGGETFDNIGGCENVKTFLRAILGGSEPPRVIVFLDEIEKAFAGTGTDLSGVKTEMTGTMLTWMQDNETDGLIFIGPPGAAKSAAAKATGNSAGIPTIAFDLGAMQSSLVGGSGERLRAALKVVEAVSRGRTLFIATCNSIASLPPELRRRFTLGTFFFDLPSAAERELIWAIYEKKYGVSGRRPDDEGWTGAEIKECCRKAARLRMPLTDAAQYTVPISKSAAEQVKSLRQQASGKFISASNAGLYRFEETAPAPAAAGPRRIRAVEAN